jgi:hypothetical protein
MWGGGPCFLFLFLFPRLCPQPINHQLHRAGFIRMWHPRMHLFLSAFYYLISIPPVVVVVVAFGRPPLCGISVRAQLVISI